MIPVSPLNPGDEVIKGYLLRLFLTIERVSFADRDNKGEKPENRNEPNRHLKWPETLGWQGIQGNEF